MTTIRFFSTFSKAKFVEKLGAFSKMGKISITNLYVDLKIQAKAGYLKIFKFKVSIFI